MNINSIEEISTLPNGLFVKLWNWINLTRPTKHRSENYGNFMKYLETQRS